LTAVGFFEKESLGIIHIGPVSVYEPFKKKGKLGVRYKHDKRTLIDADFTYIEAFSIEYDIFFMVGNDGKYGLYYKDCEIIPVQYRSIVQMSHTPKIFFAYRDDDDNQFDVYWQKGLLAKDCKECFINAFYVKVKYIDDDQELFYFCDNYETETIIPKGKYNIQLYKDYIIVDDGTPVVYNYKGCKVSEDVSGNYVQYDQFLIHITDKPEKFYNNDGKEVDLYKIFEDVVMADEYVLGKHRGHWRLLYSV
jgi:hypothetical protein